MPEAATTLSAADALHRAPAPQALRLVLLRRARVLGLLPRPVLPRDVAPALPVRLRQALLRALQDVAPVRQARVRRALRLLPRDVARPAPRQADRRPRALLGRGRRRPAAPARAVLRLPAVARARRALPIADADRTILTKLLRSMDRAIF
jgi:hypothetical protein